MQAAAPSVAPPPAAAAAQGPHAVAAAFLLVLAAGCCAPLGACVVAFLNPKQHRNLLPASLALAAGVMIYVSLYEVRRAQPACMRHSAMRHAAACMQMHPAASCSMHSAPAAQRSRQPHACTPQQNPQLLHESQAHFAAQLESQALVQLCTLGVRWRTAACADDRLRSNAQPSKC